ncbi:hypothetical protein [Parasphingorhabdus sp.]|uniref:hypothetical protein n=1 Tax=Parasphingorhabdus sp. TaxID=2709688 RepID=UPI0035937EA9
MMPGLTAEGRRYRRCRIAMQMALRLNITPAEAQRRMRHARRESRKSRQLDRIDNSAVGQDAAMIDQCGTRFEDFNAQWMLRD